jgi:hypothetical protein
MKNIQTGNKCSVLQFDNYARIVYTEYLKRGKFLVVSYASEGDSHAFIQTDDDAVTENLGDQSCLDDCLQAVDDAECIPGWHCPQTLGI